MIQFNGHFDGQVITPDERVEIPANTPLRVRFSPLPEISSNLSNGSGCWSLASRVRDPRAGGFGRAARSLRPWEARRMTRQFADTYYLLGW